MHRRHQSTTDTSAPVDDAEAEAGGGGGGGVGMGGDWNPNQCYIYIDLAHVGEYDAALLGRFKVPHAQGCTEGACCGISFSTSFSCHSKYALSFQVLYWPQAWGGIPLAGGSRGWGW